MARVPINLADTIPYIQSSTPIHDGNFPTLPREGFSGGSDALNWAAPDLDTASVVTIQTDGTFNFGTKSSAPSVLFAKGSDVWEDGVLNTYENGRSELEVVAVGASTIWNRGGDGGAGGGLPKYTKTNLRNSEVDQQYLAQEGGWLGWPLAHGGDTTALGDLLYAAFHLYSSNNISQFREISYTGLTGTFDDGATIFDQGEELEVSGYLGLGSTMVYIDTVTETIHFEKPSTGDKAGLNGKTVTGLTSGATLVLNTDGTYQSPESTKSMRIWENPARTSTATLFQNWARVLAGTTYDNFNVQDDRVQVNTVPAMVAESWLLMEYGVDNSGATGNGFSRVNNADYSSYSGLDITHKSTVNGPTIANFGNEQSPDGNTEVWFGDVYMDTSFQRVVIGNAATFATCTTLELQRLITWSTTEITCSLYHADLADGWLYVVDQNNTPVTTTGVKII